MFKQALSAALAVLLFALPVKAGPSGGSAPGIHAGAAARLLKSCGNWKDRQDAFREAKALLDAGADPNARDPDTGSTPLIEAAQAGNAKLAALLLDRGADIGAADGEGRTALIGAANGKSPETIAMLLDRGADVHAMANNGETPLTAAASIEPYGDVHEKSAECTALLLKQGASPNSSVHGMTALMGAAMEGSLKVMSLLLDHGASINAGDSDGATALMWAGSEGQADAVRLLLARGAAMKDSFGRPFLVLPSDQGWVLLAGWFSGDKKTGAVLSIYAPLLKQSFKPAAAWISFGGTPERLKGTYMETERTHRWTFADPVVLLKRLALAKGPLVLRLDSTDGRRVSATFPLKGVESAIVAALVEAVP